MIFLLKNIIVNYIERSEYMIIDKKKFDYFCAEKCLKLNQVLQAAQCSCFVGNKINNNLPMKPYTVGKIAKALNVSVAELILQEGG